MLHNTNLRHHLTQKMSASFVAGAIVWALLLAKAAAEMRHITSTATHDVSFGPLVLTRMSKTIQNDGSTTASFAFWGGIIWYIVFWLALGALIGYAAYRRSSKKAAPPS